MNVLVLWLMIKLNNFFYDTGKCLALSKKPPPNGGVGSSLNGQENLREKNFVVTKDYSFANSGFCFGYLSLYNAPIKCNLYNCDNVNRRRMKNVAEK